MINTHGEEIKPSREPVGIVMGDVGSGKTTLFNKVCGTNREARWCPNSLTRSISMHNSVNSFDPFVLIDTPGTNSPID